MFILFLTSLLFRRSQDYTSSFADLPFRNDFGYRWLRASIASDDHVFPSCEMSYKPLCTYKRASAAFSGCDYRDYYRTVYFFRARTAHTRKGGGSSGRRRDYFVE